MRTLVLGGIRSGKSEYAESLLGAAPARYIATARPVEGDADFAARIVHHAERRPAHWTLTESDAVQALRTGGATLLDDVGGWLVAEIDRADAWESPRGTVDSTPLVDAVAAFDDRLVLVSSEVGFTVVPATASGRLFGDEIGALNQRLAAVCDEVVLVVAGLPLRLKG